MTQTDQTHDPRRRSWVESANLPGSDFPLQNLPYGVFQHGDDTLGRIGVAIGDQVLDLVTCHENGLLEGVEGADAVTDSRLNLLMALPKPERVELRHRIFALLADDAGVATREAVRSALIPQAHVRMLLPARVGDYTDFYASIDHATNVGSMFRSDNPLLPNYKHIPIGYHGRASSLVVSGSPVRRPHGQTQADDAAAPTFGPTRLLDYEMEVGLFVGPGNALGEPLPVTEAEDHLFGLCLVNDWSARDLQKWEYVPLGPFLAKSFATTVSPWVVTAEALAAYRVHARQRPPEDPQPLPYLTSDANTAAGGIDLQVEVWLQSARMRQEGHEPVRLSRGRFRDMYWTAAQMLTHHASNGCNLNPGDLLASGTVSGPDKENRGCLLELTWRGAEPLSLPTGEERKFLADGDEVIFRGFCETQGRARIGFGECRGVIEAAG